MINTEGIHSIETLPENMVKIAQLTDIDDLNRSYSSIVINLKNNIKNGVLYPPKGGIFELKYPEVDIVINS